MPIIEKACCNESAYGGASVSLLTTKIIPCGDPVKTACDTPRVVHPIFFNIASISFAKRSDSPSPSIQVISTLSPFGCVDKNSSSFSFCSLLKLLGESFCWVAITCELVLLICSSSLFSASALNCSLADSFSSNSLALDSVISILPFNSFSLEILNSEILDCIPQLNNPKTADITTHEIIRKLFIL